jgi:hypothetical protein
MTNGYYIDESLFIVDGIEHPVVSNSDSPKVCLACELSTAPWAGILCKVLDHIEDSLDEPDGERFELFAC